MDVCERGARDEAWRAAKRSDPYPSRARRRDTAHTAPAHSQQRHLRRDPCKERCARSGMQQAACNGGGSTQPPPSHTASAFALWASHARISRVDTTAHGRHASLKADGDTARLHSARAPAGRVLGSLGWPCAAAGVGVYAMLRGLVARLASCVRTCIGDRGTASNGCDFGEMFWRLPMRWNLENVVT